MLILHIVKKEEWENALIKGEYSPESLLKEGFIHCSTPEQIIEVANNIYKNEKNLVLLCIDTSKVKADILFECGGSPNYPHIYGKLNLDSIIKVVPFEPDSNGYFNLPEEINEIDKKMK